MTRTSKINLTIIGRIFPWQILLALVAFALCTSASLGVENDAKSRASKMSSFDPASPDASAGALEGRWKVLVVGVNEYDDERVRTLKYSKKDARDVADAFVKLGALEDEDVRVVRVPSKRKIEEECKNFFDSLRTDDKAVVFFSGHGMQFDGASGEVESFFIPRDCVFDDKKSARETAVSIDRILEQFKASRASFKWMIVDACRNDPSKSATSFGGAKGLNFTKVPESIVLLQSCQKGYVSFEGDGVQVQNSLFTLSLLKALDSSSSPADADVNGAVSFLELVKYVAAETDKLAKRQEGEPQKPYLRGDTTDFILFDGLGKSSATQARELFDEAQRLADAKKYAAAREKMREVVELDPANQTYASYAALLETLSERPVATSAPSATSSTKREAGARKVVTINGVEVAFRWAPAGRFTMGCPEDEEGHSDSEMQHEVILTQGFWLAETETTQALWKAVMGSNPSEFTGDDLLPVENVSWEDCQEFIRKLNGLKVSGTGTFRLPTESEWEYACRAGTTTAFPWGNVLNGDKANCNGNYPYGTETKGKYLEKTTRVGSYESNAWGLYDMIGNVWEWCQDWYDDYPSGTQTDPQGAASGVGRVLRGGSWIFGPRDCRSAYRHCNDPANRRSDYGFRLAMTGESALSESSSK